MGRDIPVAPFNRGQGRSYNSYLWQIFRYSFVSKALFHMGVEDIYTTSRYTSKLAFSPKINKLFLKELILF